MSIDVTIKQKLFGNKTIPLDVILGDSLTYGNFVNDCLIPGELGDSEFIAYNPEAIGRGFSVVWNPREKKRIDLRLPQPSTPRELEDFYGAVERITVHWNGKLIVDGNVVSLPVFLNGLKEMIAFNDRWLQDLVQKLLNGESESWTFYSAKWPLEMGREEAKLFAEDPGEFALWLHAKQSVNACFAFPQFYNTEHGITGVFFITNDVIYLFPDTPAVPFGMTNPATGKPLACNRWRAALILEGAQDVLAEMDYSDFISRIPVDLRERLDARRFVCPAFSKEELEQFAQK